MAILLLFEIVLYATGPISALYFASKGYKTYRIYEYTGHFILGLLHFIVPEYVYAIMVSHKTLLNQFNLALIINLFNI